MKNNQKLFAFKLAEKNQNNMKPNETKWKARDDVAVAGCTDYLFPGNLRYGTRFSADGGVYC